MQFYEWLFAVLLLAGGFAYAVHEIKELRRKRQKPSFLITISFNAVKIQTTNMKQIEVQLGHAPFSVSAIPINLDGSLGEIQSGTQEHKSSDEAVILVEEDPNDETSAKVTPQGVGTAYGEISGDSDPGDGTKTITTRFKVIVTKALATGFAVTVPNPEGLTVTDIPDEEKPAE